MALTRQGNDNHGAGTNQHEAMTTLKDITNKLWLATKDGHLCCPSDTINAVREEAFKTHGVKTLEGAKIVGFECDFTGPLSVATELMASVNKADDIPTAPEDTAISEFEESIRLIGEYMEARAKLLKSVERIKEIVTDA